MRTIVALIVLFLVACDGDSPAGPADPLAGVYDWVTSTGGFAGQTRTPASEGYEIRLELDGHGGARVRRDGVVVASATYHLTELPTAGPLTTWELTWSPVLPVFPFAAFDRNFVNTQSLGIYLFTDPCCDGWAHTFSRFGVR